MRVSRVLLALSVGFCFLAAVRIVQMHSSVVVAPANSPPIAVDDNYTVHGSLVVNPLSNDSDPDGDTLIFDGLPVGPRHGVFTNFAPDQFRYIANNGYVGPDNFTYSVRDKFFASAIATININVVNQTPVASPDSYTVRGGNVVTKPLVNDTDADGDQIVFDSIGSPPSHGVVVGIGGDQYRYVPNSGYQGSDTFTYVIRDNLFAYATGTVTLFVVGDGENNGICACNAAVGGPINVTNGNMYLEQSDYNLPGVGPSISVTRTYNSNSQRVGLFGRGWSSEYDVAITTYDTSLTRFDRADGRGIYFARTPGSAASLLPLVGDFHASLVQSNGTTLTMTDGSAAQFNAGGKPMSLSDRSGNQTTFAYDSNGKLTSVTDPLGRVLSFTTNLNGQVTSISDSLGTVATYLYSTTNLLLAVTYADNSAFRFSYDFNNRLTTVTDALGNVIESHTYDSAGRAISSERHGGVEHYSLNYVSDTQTEVTDAMSHVTRYTIDKSKGRNIVSRVEGLCNCGSGSAVETWTYDDRLNVIAKADALNHITSFTYDANGNALTRTDATGTVTFTYNQFAEVLSRMDQLGNVTTNIYDAQGKLLTNTDALNQTSSFAYNSRGQVASFTNARGKTTTLTYDAAGNLSQQRDANGITTFFFYDARGRLTKVRDGLSRSTLYAYDAAGRLSKITHPDLSFISLTYDLAGRRVAATDERGNVTNYDYDAAYRLNTVTDALNHATTYSYDLMSNPIAVTDALGRATNYEYDEFNRLKKVIYPPASTGSTRLFETVVYDLAGNVKQRTDTGGRVTSYAYDDIDRLVAITDPANQVTAYQYDALSRVTKVTDALNQQYQFGYDAIGQQTTMTRGGASMTFQYDAAGNEVQRTDYNGVVTGYVYDNLNRLTTVNYPTRTVSYSYDPLNNLTRATNENGSIYIGYDNRYRVSSFSDPFYYGISYTYDAAGNRTKLKLNGATYASYTYDSVNRMTNLTDGANQNFPHSYDAVNRLISRSAPNGITSSYSYDDLDRLTALNHAGANTLLSNSYSYDSRSDLTGWTNASGNHVYTYDPVDRLTSATQGAQPTENYSYDSVGNRTASHLSAIYNYQPLNKLSSTSSANYTYDNNGNLLAKTNAAGTTTFAWNEENQLTQVTLPNGVIVNYKYDALGRRIQRTTSAGASERYVYDGADVLLDLNADWSVATTYLNGPRIDNHLRQNSATLGASYFLTDHLGSTAALSDAAGNVLEQLAYDSFGNGGASSRTRYTYTGRGRDPDTGLMHYRARFYDPQVGRFISEDPIGLGGGINQYSYVSNSPLDATDPSGLFEIDVHYYLTYYLAIKAGCSASEARQIAGADQRVDEDKATRPGPGWKKSKYDPTGYLIWTEPDYRQQQINADFHSLHAGSHEPYLRRLWSAATAPASLDRLGIYLHYFQDMYSHEGYNSPLNGHGLDLHYPDKTSSDVEKAMRMAHDTFYQIRRFATETRCFCRNPAQEPDWDRVRAFMKASGGPDWREINATELEIKRKILDVPPR